MALPKFSMQELIEAGVHFGHKTRRWNPKMAPYLYGVRNDVHIIDLQQTVPLLHQALDAVRETVANNGRVLFVGTKRQASEIVAEAAARCGQYYVNERWLGGMLTNWATIQGSIRKLRQIEEQMKSPTLNLTKKERLGMERDRQKLERSLGGIKEMGGTPDIVFILDTNREDLAIAEAAKLGIPIIAVLDSNSSTDNITYPVPGNDDATKAIRLYCQLLSDAALAGLQQSVRKTGQDVGASAELPEEAFKGEETRPARGAKKDAKEAKPARKEPAVVVKKASKKAAPKAEQAEATEVDTENKASSEAKIA